MKNLLSVCFVAVVTVAALAMAGSLTAANKGACGPITPEEPACFDATDCEGLPHVECVGSWSCDAGACSYDCNVEPECYGDWDCGANQICEIDWENCPPPPPCDSDKPCIMIAPACGGECVDVEPQKGDCLVSADCAPGEYCTTEDGACLPWAACPMCDVCAGLCQPKTTGECSSDADCGNGFYCEFTYDCGIPLPCDAPAADGEDGFAEPPPCAAEKQPADCIPTGVCVPKPSECFSDSDCGAGFICQLDYDTCWGFAGTETPDGDAGAPQPPPDESDMACMPVGECVPAPVTECWSDWDCPDGFHCEAAAWAQGGGSGEAPATDTDCDPSADGCGAGVAAPMGICVANDNSCNSDADCDPGFSCQEDMCSGWCDSNGWCEDSCTFACKPIENECASDWDCPAGYVCEGTGVCPSCAEGEPCPPCWFSGVCVPSAPAGCESDSDCAAGETCELQTVCAECLGCGCTTQGVCVPSTVPGGCYWDGDCGAGQYCSTSIGDCQADPSCPMCAVCYGTCLDSKTCYAASDCGPGEYCSFETCPYMDGGAGGGGSSDAMPVQACDGVCKPAWK